MALPFISPLKMLLNPAGGLKYHWHARRYAKLWRPFCSQLQSWMAQWQPPVKGLIIIGASGGYTLSTEYLKGFSSIVGVDPDPLAYHLFKRQHAGLKKLDWVAEDHMVSVDPAKGLRQLKQRYKDHGVLFCNFLGQLRFLHTDPNDEAAIRLRLKELAAEMMQGPFLSFHDRLSGPMEVNLDPLPNKKSNHALLLNCYESGKKAELLDHFTDQLFDPLESKFFKWQLFPGQYHLIEGVFHL